MAGGSDRPAVPVALGVFYVYRDPAEHQIFLQSRSRRTVDWASLSLGLNKPEKPPRERSAPRPAEASYMKHRTEGHTETNISDRKSVV